MLQVQGAGGGMPGAGFQQAKKGTHGCLKALGYAGGFAVFLGVIALYFWFQDSSLRRHGLAQIEAMTLTGDAKRVYLALADYHHLRASNSGTRVTKKSTGIPSKEQYWTVLKGLIEADLAEMPERPDFTVLNDNSFRLRVGDVHYLLVLGKDGTYENRRYWDAHFKSEDESWSHTGTWRADGDGFHWELADGGKLTDRILRMGSAGFVLDGDNNGIEFWKFYVPKRNLERSR